MNILMILTTRFPPDIRVEKEARALLAAGHDVHVLCSESGEGPAADTWHGVHIYRRPRSSTATALIRKANTAMMVLLFLDVSWARTIANIVKAHAIDALHVHNLPMVRTALFVSGIRKVPVIADLHENYPALKEMDSRNASNVWGRFRHSGRRWKRYERRSVPKCAQAIAVVEEMRDRLVANSVPPDLITIVENTTDFRAFSSMPVDRSLRHRYEGEFVISYIGYFGQHRGIDTAIESMTTVLRHAPNARLVLVGDGKERPKYEMLAARLGVAQRIDFTGLVDFSQVPSYIEASDVCLVPLHSTPQTEAASAHKLFQYMAKGKPVIVSSCKALKRVVLDCQAGLVFPAGDSQELARAILALRDDELRRRLGEAGRQAVSGRYDWSFASQRLVDMYAALQDGNARMVSKGL